MSISTRTVLITGCSDGGLGASLALAFHKAGLHVYASARNPDKMSALRSAGIETLALDITSASSIAETVAKIPSLDILVNNAGSQFIMPVVDLDISEAKKLFDLNVWAHVAVTQAFVPLLLKSKDPHGAMIVNQTSIAAVAAVPWQSVYNSSKAALAMLTEILRFELAPFGVKVVDLRTGIIQSNLTDNFKKTEPKLPQHSIYNPARKELEAALRQDGYEGSGTDQTVWAEQVVKDLLRKDPPKVIWKGQSAWLARVGALLPSGVLDGVVKKLSGLDVVETVLAKAKKD